MNSMGRSSSRDEQVAATVIEGLLRRLYELNADDHPAEEAARAYLAQHSTAAKELPTPEEVRGILPKPPPGGWPDSPGATTEWGPALCAGTEFDSECDCGCGSYDGNPSHECDWPDCGCGCKPLCSGCDAVQANA